MEAPLRVLILEDEFLTLNSIRESLHEAGYQVSGVAKNAEEALKVLEEGQTDLAILDIFIQGDKNGIWLANEINRKYNIPFIFLTAYSDEQTVRSAIQSEPYGYLIKPFNSVDIYTAIEVALKNFWKIQAQHDEPNKESGPVYADDHLFIKEQHLYSKIKVSDIQYIKAEMKYILLKTEEKEYHPRHTFSEFTARLPEETFIQVHRSYTVNKLFVDHIGPNFLMVGQKEIPISSQRRDAVYKAFKFV